MVFKNAISFLTGGKSLFILAAFVIVAEFVVGTDAVIPDFFVLIDHAIGALILEVVIMAGILNWCFDF